LSPTVSGAQEVVPRFEPADCPIEVPDSPPIDCGYLIVPEDYDDPESGTIRLPVIIIHSRNDNPAPDPLLFTEGGPGYSSLGAVWWLAKSVYVDDRDVVILEQRGNRHAEPSLVCDTSVWWEEGVDNAACLDSLLDQGIDLTHYTTSSIVADIDALRQVLDYDEWNLYGVSYSTRLMLLTMHLHPEGIRSVILQSVSRLTETRYQHDPEHPMRSLKVLFDDCAADPACAAAYPELESKLYALVKRLNAEPVTFKSVRKATGEPVTIAVDGNMLLGWMIDDAFYSPARPPHRTAYLPLLIHEVERGNTDLLYAWAVDRISRLSSESAWAFGLYFAVNCQDDAPAVTSEDMAAQAATNPELDGYSRHKRELAICDAWNLPASAPLVTEPVKSDIPTLVLAGTYDPVTPPEWSRTVAENLSNSYYYEFPSSGHNVSTDNPCSPTIIAAFLNDPTVAPDAGCIAEMPGPEFVLPQDILIASSIYEIHYREIGYTLIEQGLFLGSLMVLILEIGFLIVAGTVRLVRRRERQTQPDLIVRFAHPLAGVVAVLTAGFSLALRSVLRHVAATDSMVLRFGVPTEYGPLFIIPLVTAVLTVGIFIFAVLAWARGYWSLPGRVFFSLVTLAAVVFAAIGAYWGLLTLLF